MIESLHNIYPIWTINKIFFTDIAYHDTIYYSILFRIKTKDYIYFINDPDGYWLEVVPVR